MRNYLQQRHLAVAPDGLAVTKPLRAVAQQLVPNKLKRGKLQLQQVDTAVANTAAQQQPVFRPLRLPVQQVGRPP